MKPTILVLLLSIGTSFGTTPMAVTEKLKLITVSETKELFFQQKRTLSTVDRSFISSGKITIFTNGLQLETLSPRYSWMRFDSTGVYSKKDSLDVEKRVKDANSISSVMNNLFSLIFSGEREIIESQFRINYSEKDSIWSLTLSPKEKKLAKMISAIVLNGEQSLQSITTISSSGDSTKLTFAEVAFE